MIKNFEEKFKELCVEGNRKEANSSSVMFTEEDEYYDEEEMDEDIFDKAEDDQDDSQLEDKEQETYFIGTPSQAQKRYNPPPNCSRPIFKNR